MSLLCLLISSVGDRLHATAPAAAQAPAVPTPLTSLRALIDDGQYLEAEEKGLASVDAIERTGGPDAMAIADTLDLVLEARRFSRRMTTAGTVELGERALKIKEKAVGADDPRLSQTLVMLGLARAATRSFAPAQAALARALGIRERAFGAESLPVAATLNVIASIHWQARQMTAAVEAAGRALKIARTLEHPAGNETAAALGVEASALRHQGELERAVRLFEEVLAIDERLHGPDHPALAGTLLALSGTVRDLGDIERTRALHERAIRILNASPGADRRVAFELVMLSTVLEAQGDYAAALGVCERAVAMAEKIAGPNSTLAAAALDQLALVHDNLGDHTASAAIRTRTIDLWIAAQGPESVHVGTALNGLAESYEKAGRLDAAFEVVQRALKIDALTQQPAVFARVLQTHARLLSRQHRLDEARAVLERARQTSASAPFSTARTDLAATLSLLAALERQDGRPAQSLPYYRDAIALYTKELGADHVITAERRTELAGALAETGEMDEARRLLLSGERDSIEHLRLIARTLTDRRALEFASQRRSGVDLAVTLAAAAASGASGASGASHKSGPGGPKRAATKPATTPNAPTAGAEAAAPGVANDVEMAWQMVIQGRTVILDEMAARQRTVVAEADNAVVREQWAQLNQARARLANLIVRGPEGQPAERYQALVERTRAERDRAERTLAAASVAFQHEQRRTQAGLADVLERLPRGAALVSYVRYTPQRLAPPGPNPPLSLRERARAPAAYAAFVARAGASAAGGAARPAIHVVPLGSADVIDAAVATWRARIQDELASGGLASRRNETVYREAGSALRAHLWDPIQRHLAASSSAFIVPDGAIHLVDVSTLPTGRSGYLVDAPIALHYLLAERDLVQPPPEPQGTSLLALGAPDFDKIDPAAATFGASSSLVAEQRATQVEIPKLGQRPAGEALTGQTRAACEALSTRTFAPLPATRQELQHIAQLWRQGTQAGGASGGPVLLGDDRATETAFKLLAPGRRVLHLATHGFFLDRFCGAPAAEAEAQGKRLLEESPLLRSGLVLAGANRRSQMEREEDDGILTAEEIAGLDLSAAQWAVLSACDTGRGDWQAGEGVVGLRRAFQVAGARTVILSLWPVIDTVAGDWMAELYRGKFVRGVPTATAVRAASRTLLAARRKAGQSTHPLYWSGFIATGDWR